jgi:hypothetical protein
LGGRTIGSTSDSGSDYPGSSPGLPAKSYKSPDINRQSQFPAAILVARGPFLLEEIKGVAAAKGGL